MNFTREPIIETVITPREGCKLAIRSSKGNTQEDYLVEAVEIVSFGQSLFFRSLERPKPFLVPVSDYEVSEVKETRMVLKNAPGERSIKIGGGREASFRPREPEESSPPDQAPPEKPSNHRRDRNRRRGRQGRRADFQDAPPPREPAPPAPTPDALPADEAKAPSFISKLFPPPPTLIKESIHRYKPTEPIQPADLLPDDTSAPLEDDEFPQELPSQELPTEPEEE